MGKCSQLEKHQETKEDIPKQQALFQAGSRCSTCAFLNKHDKGIRSPKSSTYSHTWYGCETHYTTITKPEEQVCESYYSKTAMNRTERITEILQ
jgi:hypothetical protein